MLLPDLTPTYRLLRARAERGAKLLDQREPGWRDLIVPSQLSIEDCTECVLGQVYGGYVTGLRRLLPRPRVEDEVLRHGFNIYPTDETFLSSGAAHALDELLTLAWLDVLKGEPGV